LNFIKKHKTNLFTVFLLTAALTAFYYIHESFPKPLRAATSLLATPTAVASGISHYLKLGIPVYETPLAVILANGIASIIIVLVADRFLQWRKKKRVK
jgi:Kef-type K+ transport system membrane component KefB